MYFLFPAQRYYRIAVSVFYFIQGFTFSSWASRIPDIKSKLQLSDAGFGAVLFTLPIGQLTAMAISSYLVSHFGSKRTLTLGATLYPAALVLLGIVSSVWQLVAGLFLFAMFANLSNISVNTQGIGIERLYRRSIMASFHGIWSLAGFTGGLVSTFMVAENIGTFKHFCIIYAVTLTLMLSARSFLMPRDEKRPEKQKTRIFVKPDKLIVTIGLIAFGSLICEGMMVDWSGLYFVKIIHPPKELIRLGFIAYMCTMASGRFAADWMVTRFGIIRILQFSGVTITVGLLIAVIIPHLITATLGFLLVGLGTSSVVPLCFSLAGKSKVMLPGVAIATVSSIGFLGFLIGPPTIGFLAQISSLRLSFMVIAFIGLLTTVMARRLKHLGVS